MKKDITTKEVITTITKDIAKYILDLEISDIEFIDKELKRVEKREADIVAKCQIGTKEKILHIEIQNSNDKKMHRRMLRYYNDIKFEFENTEVMQYCIYIGKQKLSMQTKIEEPALIYSYTMIDMHTIDCDKFLQIDTPDALVLSILCDFKQKNELDIVKYIIKRLKELIGEDENQLSKYMLILETLSENRDLKETIKEAEMLLRRDTI